MPNIIEYATQMQQNLDEAMVQGLTSGWMDENAGDVIYTGGREIKIPYVEMTGLGDYDRVKGYPDGSVTLSYQTVTMTQDRGKRLMVDSMDRDETAGLLDISKLMGQFNREKVIPEVDAYRYSAIAQIAEKENRALTGYTPDASTLLSALLADIAEVQDVVGEDVPLVITMAMKVASLFDQSKEISKRLEVTDFVRGDIKTKVRSLDGEIPILRVGSGRMKTKYEFYDGVSEASGSAPDQTVGGFIPAADAKDINWIITPRKAPLGITKQDKVRLWTPDTFQDADAFAGDYRRYHDLWIKKSQLKSIIVNTK